MNFKFIVIFKLLFFFGRLFSPLFALISPGEINKPILGYTASDGMKMINPEPSCLNRAGQFCTPPPPFSSCFLPATILYTIGRLDLPIKTSGRNKNGGGGGWLVECKTYPNKPCSKGPLLADSSPPQLCFSWGNLLKFPHRIQLILLNCSRVPAMKGGGQFSS